MVLVLCRRPLWSLPKRSRRASDGDRPSVRPEKHSASQSAPLGSVHPHIISVSKTKHTVDIPALTIGLCTQCLSLSSRSSSTRSWLASADPDPAINHRRAERLTQTYSTAYLQSLAKRPILTKSCTSGLLSFVPCALAFETDCRPS